MAKIENLASRNLDELELSPAARRALDEIQTELTEAYQDYILELVEAVRQQASAISRIQSTLNILVEHLAPQLAQEAKFPIAFHVAESAASPDLARALVVADPIAAGYTLTQADLAKALDLSQADVSILVRAFKLTSDENCAITVRKGKSREMVNYHPRAARRFLELVRNPPKGFGQLQKEQNALRRVNTKLQRTSRK